MIVRKLLRLVAVLVALDEAAAHSTAVLSPLANDHLGRRALSADVFVHRGLAYVGHWSYGRGIADENGCLATIGVSVVDVRTPSAPQFVATLAAPSFTTAEDVEVLTASYGPLAGRDIAAAGIQACGGAEPANGLILWDTTNPHTARQLAFVSTGDHGVHELTVAERHDLKRMYVFGTVPRSDTTGRGDVRIWDITDPSTPVEVSSWGVRKDLGVDPASFHRGCGPRAYAHGVEVSPDAKLLFVSSGDAGVIILDLSDPAEPRYVGRTAYGHSDEGNAHSADYDAVRRLLFVQDEDYSLNCPSTEPGWGYLRVYDVADLANPRQIGTFRTANSKSSAAALYTIHHAVLAGTTLYASWYGDGIRVIDVSDPTSPHEIGAFVPPPAPAPLEPVPQAWPSPATNVWGVAVDRANRIVYGSDFHSGLWIIAEVPTRRRGVSRAR